jgi:hypothetical protein
MGNPIKLDTNFYSTGTSWWKTRTETIKHKYMNGEINLSPYLHEKVYGECLDIKNRTWTPCVENHIMIFWGPAGNINTNDYRYIPMEFRQLFWNIVIKFSGNDSESMFTYLNQSYGITDGLASILVWYYLSGKNIRKTLENDSL